MIVERISGESERAGDSENLARHIIMWTMCMTAERILNQIKKIFIIHHYTKHKN